MSLYSRKTEGEEGNSATLEDEKNKGGKGPTSTRKKGKNAFAILSTKKRRFCNIPRANSPRGGRLTYRKLTLFDIYCGKKKKRSRKRGGTGHPITGKRVSLTVMQWGEKKYLKGKRTQELLNGRGRGGKHWD